jgi:hypothetical protein
MSAHEFPGPRSAGSRIEAVLTWLGGGHWHELGELHERSTHAIAGVVVALAAALAWLVATLAVGESVRWPVPAILPFTLVFGLLAGAVIRGTASGPTRGWTGVAGRAAVTVAVGVVVGELATLVLFSGSIDRRLEAQAGRTADSAPAVAQASAALEQTSNARTALDNAVQRAREHRDQALVVARCEYHPTPACPQTRITGVPGVGPETRTANEILAATQRELDNAVAARDSRAPALDAKITKDEQALARARETAIAGADRGIGARWVAMNELTLASAGAFVLRLVTIAFFSLLYLLPLILRLWRGETTHDRHAAARAKRDRAEIEAETAIAVKCAEVRREAETLWAEQQLAKARFAVQAQTEIDRAQYRRRVAEALDGPVRASSQREPEPDDIYLPIAAEAEAASLVAAQLPSADRDPGVNDKPDENANYDGNENLPATIRGVAEPHSERGTPLIPDVTKVAARWIRPLVPSFVARAVDTATLPVRAARQVLEEVEEITFSLKSTRKVTVNTETQPFESATTDARGDSNRVESSRADRDVAKHGRLDTGTGHSALGRAPAEGPGLSLDAAEGEWRPELTGRHEPRELRGPDGPRQLPSAE